MRILVTGGAGYLGSHTTLALLQSGHDVTVFDNFANSSPLALRRVSELAEAEVRIVEGDLTDRRAVDGALKEAAPDAVIHFAGLKAVGESHAMPLRYFSNNICGTVSLLEAMNDAGARNLIFSSSATVYGAAKSVPVTEDQPLSAINPYGRTKLMVEEILRDLASSDRRWSIGILRYFNPVGAHESGLLGEDPRGTPNNLVPFVGQVALGQRPRVNIFGADFETPDGTGVRDYVHVLDLAQGHISALNAIMREPGARVWNLGTGRGYSVREVIAMYAEVSGRPIESRVVLRRPGDVAVSFADATKALRDLGWKAERGLAQMVADHWRWQSMNPGGYVDRDAPTPGRGRL